MIQKPKDYDDVPATTTEFKRLVDGGYEGIIKNAEVKTITTKAGNKVDILALELDINAGEYKDFYKERYEKNTNQNKKWGLTKDLFLESEHNSQEQNQKNVRRLKEFITSVEQSNYNFEFKWNDEKDLIGKKVGMIFGLEEFETTDKKAILTTPKLRFFRSVETVNSIDYSLPQNKLDVKLLDGSFVKYTDYKAHTSVPETQDQGDFITVEEDSDEIPF